jgi:hypothetical protein
MQLGHCRIYCQIIPEKYRRLPRLVGSDFLHSVLRCRWRCAFPVRRRTTAAAVVPVRCDSVSLLLQVVLSDNHSSELRRRAALFVVRISVAASVCRIRRRRDELRTSSSACAASLAVKTRRRWKE